MLINLTLGLIFSSLMGAGGYYKKALSKSGVVGAILVGTMIFSLGGWAWGLILITFFVSSSVFSRFKKSDKSNIAEKFDKGSQRDIGQVLANGGLGAIIALVSVIWPNPLWWWAFLGAMGTVNADTWATELGVLSKATPRLVTTGKPVVAGTSGGITMAGTMAAFSGGLLIGLMAWALNFGQQQHMADSRIMLIAGLGGLAGAMIDSFLGATVQAIYYCNQCNRETERVTCCRAPTQPIKGQIWLNNDWVNFSSSIGGALTAIGIGGLLF